VTIMTDTAVAHPYNPDPFYEGCQATGLVERGVSFPSVEPMDGTIMFLGETAMVEAIGVLFDLSPDEVRQRLDNESSQRVELSAAKRRITQLEEELSGWHSLKDSLAETGLLVTAFD
jgi:hypothetical protein